LADENEAIADAFLSANSDFVLVPANTILAQQQINLDTGNYLKLLPHLHGTDGFFAAVFERKVEASKKVEALNKNAESKSIEQEANSSNPSGASKMMADEISDKKPVKTKPKAAAIKAEKTRKT
jgi:16S rRNA (cytosine967-C5)-methyltransferase